MTNSARDFRIPIWVQEEHGIARSQEPVRLGVPLPKGLIHDPATVRLTDQTGESLPFQGYALAFWPDQSVKWLLVDFFAAVKPKMRTLYTLSPRHEPTDLSAGGSPPILKIKESPDSIEIDTGQATFIVTSKPFRPFATVRMRGAECLTAKGSRIRLTDLKGAEYVPQVDRMSIEERGPLRASLCVEGSFVSRRLKPFLRFKARMAFFSGSSLAGLEFQVRNPRAAVHPGGLWDLGDPGSVHFRDLSLQVAPHGEFRRLHWCAEGLHQTTVSDAVHWVLYQDSSGGENWQSGNHVDRHGNLSVSFRGYRAHEIQNGKRRLVAEGERADPYARLETTSGWVGAAIENCWQNFPKALRFENGLLNIGLFPAECSSGFELQGGEQKRHNVFWEFGSPEQNTMIPAMLHPLHVWVDPAWVEESKAIPYFIAQENDPDKDCMAYVQNVIEGPHSFFAKREVIDEYGWRNFGDLYGDHEAVNHSGPAPLVSHYNNQYDFIYGALAQYLRTGDRRWFQLMRDAARHTIDIDIYHTDGDKPAYNHGLFWHTDHYRDAGAGTHRTYSRKNRGGGNYGGGPSNEHNYTSGLLHYFYLTGDPEAAEAVLELADWVIGMDDGSRTLLGLVDEGPTGGASSTVSTLYHKPGRGAGNSINALIDAYRLSNKHRYLTKAEELIQRCVHPHDDIPELTLDDPEYRWSYLVFLQVLGKYLELKSELDERDYCYFYARDSLLHYAQWMVEHEVPYKDVLHKVLIPTETWPAHDIRKCHVFHLAAACGDPDRRRAYREKADFFFKRCLSDLLSFETACLTRPLVILTVYGHVHGFFERYGDTGFEFVKHTHDFGRPNPFLPQSARLKTACLRKLVVLAENLRRVSRGKWVELKNRCGDKA